MLTCIVIPHFDHLAQFQKFLPAIVKQGLPLVIVDDASPAPVFDALEELLKQQAADSVLIRHVENLGKGGAVMTGLEAAKERGYTHAIQIDADGQHDISGIASLVSIAKADADCIVCGLPVFDSSISGLRYYARFLTLYLVWLETLSTVILDGMCGYRLYPLNQVVALVNKSRPGKRMAFDPEILVRAVWSGISLRFVPVHITYPEDGRSHFHYFRDNLEISWMHTRLIFGMLLRIPHLIRQNRLRRMGRKL